MKGTFGKLVNTALVFALFAVAYLLISTGLTEAVGKEVQRYSNVNVNYIYIFITFVFSSYFIGYIFSKLKI